MRVRTKLAVSAFLLAFVPVLTVSSLALLRFSGFSSDSSAAAEEALTTEAKAALAVGVRRERELITTLLNTVDSSLLSLSASEPAKGLLACLARDPAELRKTLAELDRTVVLAADDARSQIGYLEMVLQRQSALGQLILSRLGPAHLDGTRPDQRITNQETGAATTETVPVLRFGDTAMDLIDDPQAAVPVVDESARAVGGLFTIFQRLPDGRLLRVATNVLRKDGRRAVGTCIPAITRDGKPNAVAAAIGAGKVYEGLAQVVGETCVTSYTPLIGADGSVIGAFFAGLPLRELKTLNATLVNRNVNLPGYGFAIDGAGRFAAHPRAEWIGKHIIDDLKLDFLRPVLDNRLAAGQTTLFEYQLEQVKKAFVYTRIPEWNWTVGFASESDAILAATTDRQRAIVIEQARQTYAAGTLVVRRQDKDERVHLYNQIRLLDPNGMELINLQQGEPAKELKDKSGMAWCKAALQAPPGSIYWAPLEIAANTGRTELRAVRPMHANGQLRGLVAISIDWQAINDLITQHAYGQTGYPWMVDGNGLMAMHPVITLKDKAVISDATRFPGLAELSGSIMGGQTGTGRYVYKGVDKLIAFGPVDIGGHRYGLAAAAPASEMLRVASDLRASSQRTLRATLWQQGVIGMVIVALSVLIGLFLSRRLVGPLERTGRTLSMVATGDLRTRLDIASKDEFGEMATALNQALTAMGDATRTIGGHAGTVGGQAQQLTDLSGRLGSSSASSAGEAKSTADTATQMANSVGTVAAAVEELNASIREIAQNAQKAAEAANQGVTSAEAASADMAKLSSAAEEIGDIIKLINSIAEQVNLLALNATIEAARAGDAGRGFAVVAGEVKDLARRTQAASADISQRIGAIQDGVRQGGVTITRVAESIRSINALQQTVATAVEEQAATTSEMGRAVQDASGSAQGIATSAAALAAATSDTDRIAGEVGSAATRLGALASELQQAVGRFKA